jgi:cobalamin biosynthesis Co2+ chelatase CbiK
MPILFLLIRLIETEIIKLDREIKTPLSRYKDIARAFATATTVKTLIDRSVMNLEKPFNALSRTVKKKYKGKYLIKVQKKNPQKTNAQKTYIQKVN